MLWCIVQQVQYLFGSLSIPYFRQSCQCPLCHGNLFKNCLCNVGTIRSSYLFCCCTVVVFSLWCSSESDIALDTCCVAHNIECDKIKSHSCTLQLLETGIRIMLTVATLRVCLNNKVCTSKIYSAVTCKPLRS